MNMDTISVRITYGQARDLARILRTMRLQLKAKDYGAAFLDRVADLEISVNEWLDRIERAHNARMAVRSPVPEPAEESPILLPGD